jgi:hypothetical protein
MSIKLLPQFREDTIKPVQDCLFRYNFRSTWRKGRRRAPWEIPNLDGRGERVLLKRHG